LEDFHLNVVKASIGKDETMDKMREPSIGGYRLRDPKKVISEEELECYLAGE
jgi:hypothetical protein